MSDQKRDPQPVKFVPFSDEPVVDGGVLPTLRCDCNTNAFFPVVAVSATNGAYVDPKKTLCCISCGSLWRIAENGFEKMTTGRWERGAFRDEIH